MTVCKRIGLPSGPCSSASGSRSPTRKGPRSVFTIDQSPDPSTSSRTPSIMRVSAFAQALPDIARTVSF
jgi:hypothetical protein